MFNVALPNWDQSQTLNELEAAVYPVTKRLFDLLCSILGLVVLSPVLLVIAVVIKFDSVGPAIYGGMRVGLNGRLFRMYKLRTMVVNADKIGGYSTPDDDPRVTRMGRFLRKYKLDELPQLINVLKGEMSFVGPRPEVQYFVDKYTEEEKAILTVQPGITDWASLWGVDQGAILAGSSDPDKDYFEKIRPKKIRLQLKYVQERSFWNDIAIILHTAHALLSRNNDLTKGRQI
jgi:lipopolysaccharide/colanic/teichoic acid biosynthesis glycosyltransferase